MILTCPQCGERFSLDAHLLAPNGRKVRCAACKHTWHQLPDPAELGETLPADEGRDIEADLERLEDEAHAERKRFTTEDIPKALRPDHDSGISDASPQEKAHKRRVILNVAAGFLAVLLPATLIVYAAQPSLVRLWPAFYGLYDTLGMAKPVAGEGLVFEKMAASLRKSDDGKLLLHIGGQIINLKGEDQRIPPIEAALRDEAGEELSRWLIAPPEPVIKAESSMPFTAETEFTHDKAVSINLRFLAGEPKTVSEGGGNTQAPPEGDTAHPSGPEESSESPAHGDAPPHPESPPAHTGNSDPHSDHH